MDLPDQHHVVRYIPYQKLFKDEDGNITDERGDVYGALPQAFELRERDQLSLSVNWLECYGKDDEAENLIAVVTDMRKVISSKNSAYGIAGVAKVKHAAVSNGFVYVKVVHSPNGSNVSHSSIIRMPNNDSALMLALAEDAFTKMVLNKHIP